MRVEIDQFYKNFTGTLLLLKPNNEFVSGKLKGKNMFDRYMKLLFPQKKLFAYALLASLIVTLAGYFTDPISNLVGLQLQIQEANISMKRLSEIMDYEREQEFTISEESGIPSLNVRNESHADIHQYQVLEKADGDIEVNNVTFRYGNRRPALDGISFNIKKGQKVALVGASGSGKSTIAKLLLKYYEPESGYITIDGVDINEYQSSSIRRAISYVPQNIELF